MANQEFYSRIIHKHDTEENWIKAVNFIPKQGEIIIYDKDDNYNYERMKIGDGTSKVNDLPFNMDQISDTIADLGAITIDLEGATDGTPATVDADTFQGYTIDKFVMYNINGEDGDIDTTIDADTLGGIPAEDYATEAYVEELLGNIEVDGNFVYLSTDASDAEDTTSGITALVDADTLGGIPAKQYATKEELNTSIANIQNFLGTQVTYSLSGTTLTITTK